MAARNHDHLSFREASITRELKIRFFLLIAVFFGATAFFYITLNMKPVGQTTKMSASTLPTVTLSYNGLQMNELHGYLYEMDACYMRDTITPLTDERTISLAVNTYGRDISSIAYEVRSIDTTRKIADTADVIFKEEGNTLLAEPTLANLLERGEEYLIIFTLTVEDVPVRYYTRIMIPDNEHITDCVAFADDFHNTALSDDYSPLAPYLETNYNLDSTSLSNVSIRSTIDQVGWHGFKGAESGVRTLKLGDIGSDDVALSYDYQMKSGEGISPSYYNVEEYFKVRYTKERMYLLDYERSMEEIMDPTHVAIEENVLTVGVTGRSFEYLSNETGTITSFVTAGDLFEYNQNTNTLTKVFSFRGSDPSDPRTNYNEHNIRILDIDENGSMDYVVYGYMNAGEHEGRCGINLYRFDPSTNANTEQAFVVSTRSYQVLNANFSDLIYMDANNDFYMMNDGSLIKVNLDTLSITTLLSEMKDTQYAVSGSGRYIAWVEKEVCDHTMTVMDLEDESTFSVSAPIKNDFIRPIAFLQENLVYTLLHEEDIRTDAAGAKLFPAYRLVIAETVENGEILKEYERPGVYITDVAATSYSITMTLVSPAESGGFAVLGDDTIQNTSGEGNRAVTISHEGDDVRVEVTKVTLTPRRSKTELAAANIKTADLYTADDTRTIEVAGTEHILHYYVYVGSHIELATTSVTDAIVRADKEIGLVVDSNAKYIWKRTRPPYVNTFRNLTVGSSDQDASSSARALSAMLVREGENVEVNALLARGETPLSILSNTLKDVTVLDLTGCTLNQVLYYISIGSPVYAKTGDDEAVLLVGYDAANVVAYDPSEDRTYKIGLVDGQELFAAQGSVFISYID